RGILLIIIGILTFVSPLTWILFVAAYALIDGMVMLFSGFGDQPPGQSRWPLIIFGILGVLAGLIILYYPDKSAAVLTYVIPIWGIIRRVLTLVSAIRLS